MAKNIKTKIKIFNVVGDREILRLIESPKSWSTNGAVLKTSYVKNQKSVSITTTLPYLVEESESDESEK
jgi:hypothetical protein